MSYSSFSRTSREIALFSITYIASYLLNMRYRLIDNLSVYCGYDNSSVLLSDNICTLSNIEFYLCSTYIAIHRKQPSKSILLADYLSDNSKLHDIVVCTWIIIYLLELSVRLELTIVVYKTTVLPVKLRKHI